jgi:hypothetical protein
MRAASEECSLGEPWDFGVTDSTGPALPQSVWEEECREISKDSLPAKVVFHNRSGILNDKIRHHYRHKYSKTSNL